MKLKKVILHMIYYNQECFYFTKYNRKYDAINEKGRQYKEVNMNHSCQIRGSIVHTFLESSKVLKHKINVLNVKNKK